jgi:hypothetical protein
MTFVEMLMKDDKKFLFKETRTNLLESEVLEGEKRKEFQIIFAENHIEAFSYNITRDYLRI